MNLIYKTLNCRQVNGINIDDQLSLCGYSDDFIRQLYDRDVDLRLFIQQQEDKRNEKVYDNEAFEEQIYQALLHYPLRKVPIKDRPEILLSRIIGIAKRGLLNRKTKLLPEKNYSEDNEYAEFVYRISDLSLYNENTITVQNSKQKTIRKDENNIENSR